ncbi:ABC transporter ATP-binding protein [Kamptonema cortianum]|nr:ABC transporter ATP-binding protein [Kamptonema cortianum]
MSDTVIQVENLSKKYLIGHQKQAYTLREAISNTTRSLSHKLITPWKKSESFSQTEEFWALKDISFEVKQGDRVGIIGRNGAGKSTLLKILSRITEPTHGRITIKGRVASLLEVGTGFHPELTGRENIFLNGAILGMSKAEIKRKFDEIVDFAEIEKFIDTPVKRYSSGMYVRLAFAVAAHLEPEILVVDEVLAVGDSQFQKKCLGKMEEVGKEGRTVLFVSHQMAAVEKLCSRGIVLRYGTKEYDGLTQDAINFYLQNIEKNIKNLDFRKIKRSGTGELKIVDFAIENSNGEVVPAVSAGEDIALLFYYHMNEDAPLKNVSIGFSIHSLLGDTISILYSDYEGQTFNVNSSQGMFRCKLKNFPFSNGRYFVGARIISQGVEIDWPQDFLGYIDVEAGDFYKTGNVNHSGIGPILLRGEWQLDRIGVSVK